MFRTCLNIISSATKYTAQIQKLKLSTSCTQYNSIFTPLSQQIPAQHFFSNGNNFNYVPVRTVKSVKNDGAEPYRIFLYNRVNGKRTSCAMIPKQFYRLNWGIWIRTKCGRDKTIHKKHTGRMRRLRKHVFCNAQQSRLLDRLSAPWFKKRHYFIDDPYEPYHTRDEFLYTRNKPLPAHDAAFTD
ncbi:hypothetical protein PGB90_005889 [Kerria lacca]